MRNTINEEDQWKKETKENEKWKEKEKKVSLISNKDDILEMYFEFVSR